MTTRFSDLDVGRWTLGVERLHLRLGVERWALGVGRFAF
jgi:hypothetical protein